MADLHRAVDPHADGPEPVDWTIESVDLLAAHHSGDHVLAMYVEAFNDTPGSHLPVTLFSSGYAFSGRLVGAATYFDAVADDVDNEAISIPFRKLAQEYRAIGDDETHLVTTYVHLLDVTVFAGTTRVAKLKAWRGRLSSITGWTTERLKVKEPAERPKAKEPAERPKPRVKDKD